jgi:PleD family two-component response regulator
LRKPIKKRRRTIIRTNAKISPQESKAARPVRILHVEDDTTVAGIVSEMLENQGWQVETCADGKVALEKISGEDEYDLLVVGAQIGGNCDRE